MNHFLKITALAVLYLLGLLGLLMSVCGGVLIFFSMDMYDPLSWALFQLLCIVVGLVLFFGARMALSGADDSAPSRRLKQRLAE